jgi:protein-disulfide isomerase
MRSGDHVIGSEHPTVTLVQYGDYECPYCARAYLVLQVVLEELGDSIRYVFRNFPVQEMHGHAMTAHEAAEAVAARAGDAAFWRMHAILFENQDALEIDDLLAYAEAVGAPGEEVALDLSTGATRARVERDLQLGAQDGVTSTPTFFINGRKFNGDWADADALIEALHTAARERAHH